MDKNIRNLIEPIIDLNIRYYIVSLALRHGYASIDERPEFLEVKTEVLIGYKAKAYDLMRTARINKDDDELRDLMLERSMSLFERALDFKEAQKLAKELDNEYASNRYRQIIELEEKAILLSSL